MVSSILDFEKLIVLIDGECTFCNKTALFIIRYDHHDLFRFASQQSPLGASLLESNNYKGNDLSTVILLKEGKVFTKSTALIEISGQLEGYPKYAAYLKIVPPPIRDFFYDRFAKYRYSLFGKEKDCAIPSAEIRRRFLS